MLTWAIVMFITIFGFGYTHPCGAGKIACWVEDKWTLICTIRVMEINNNSDADGDGNWIW